MILAEKIIQLRKKHNLSQEEFAEQLNVSRQSVSKWEGAKSIPEMSKIVEISKIFNVSTDYLLRDDIEEEDDALSPLYDETRENVHRVGMEEASRFLDLNCREAKTLATAISISILSPIAIMMLGVLEKYIIGKIKIFLIICT